MTYAPLTTDELVMIELYYKNKESTAKISELLNRSRQTVHNLVMALLKGTIDLEYYKKININ